jgi:hypothetical protein
LQVPETFLHRTIQDLNEYVQGCTTELVVNFNKVGISDCENRKTSNIVLPATMRGQTIHHGISLTLKHISVIACVFAAEESLSPYMITSQDSASVRGQVKEHCVWFGFRLEIE